MTLFVKKNPTVQEMKETKGKVKVTKQIIRKPVPQWKEAAEEESIAREAKAMLMGEDSTVVQRHFQPSFFSSSRPSKPLPLQLSNSNYSKVEKEISSTTIPSPSISSKLTKDGKTISKKRTFGGSKKVMADLRRQFEEQSFFGNNNNNNNQDSPDSLNSVKSYFSSDSEYGSDASSCSSWGDGPELELLTFGDNVKGKGKEVEENEGEKTIDS